MFLVANNVTSLCILSKSQQNLSENVYSYCTIADPLPVPGTNMLVCGRKRDTDMRGRLLVLSRYPQMALQMSA